MKKLNRQESFRVRGGDRQYLDFATVGVLFPTGEGVSYERVTLGNDLHPALVGLEVLLPFTDCSCGSQEEAPTVQWR